MGLSACPSKTYVPVGFSYPKTLPTALTRSCLDKGIQFHGRNKSSRSQLACGHWAQDPFRKENVQETASVVSLSEVLVCPTSNSKAPSVALIWDFLGFKQSPPSPPPRTPKTGATIVCRMASWAHLPFWLDTALQNRAGPMNGARVETI